MPDRVTIVDQPVLDRLSVQAGHTGRRRMNLNLHGSPDEPVQRLCNAFEPGTYVQVHRHAGDDGFELFAALRGRIVLLVFDDAGVVTDRIEVGGEGARAVEVAGGYWHALAALEPGTVMLEIKAGPYRAAAAEYAGWSPAPGDPLSTAVESWYRIAAPGARIPAG